VVVWCGASIVDFLELEEVRCSTERMGGGGAGPKLPSPAKAPRLAKIYGPRPKVDFYFRCLLPSSSAHAAPNSDGYALDCSFLKLFSHSVAPRIRTPAPSLTTQSLPRFAAVNTSNPPSHANLHKPASQPIEKHTSARDNADFNHHQRPPSAPATTPIPLHNGLHCLRESYRHVPRSCVTVDTSSEARLYKSRHTTLALTEARNRRRTRRTPLRWLRDVAISSSITLGRVRRTGVAAFRISARQRRNQTRLLQMAPFQPRCDCPYLYQQSL
jgi:hypothetical protein